MPILDHDNNYIDFLTFELRGLPRVDLISPKDLDGTMRFGLAGAQSIPRDIEPAAFAVCSILRLRPSNYSGAFTH